MERKDFLKKIAAGGSILLTAPIIFSSCSEDDDPANENGNPNNNGNGNSSEIIIDLNSADFSALGTVGGFAYKDNIIICRTGETSYIALSKLCTHSQCTVTYNHSGSELPCPCHGSTFSTSGAVTNGPASSNLKKYTVTKDGNTLKIT